MLEFILQFDPENAYFEAKVSSIFRLSWRHMLQELVIHLARHGDILVCFSNIYNNNSIDKSELRSAFEYKALSGT